MVLTGYHMKLDEFTLSVVIPCSNTSGICSTGIEAADAAYDKAE